MQAREVFETCISRVRNPNLRTRLQAVAALVEQEAANFEASVRAGTMHAVSQQGVLNGDVLAEEMEKVYTNRMAKADTPGRPIYDALLAAPAYGRCPLCNQRTVSTLDHQLPKTTHSALVVAPLNLVPACKDCNTTKLDKLPASAAEVTLHPYFDNVETVTWLKARVHRTTPAAVEFYVERPDTWDNVLAERVETHFTLFKLAALYASHAAEELAGQQFILAQLHATSGGTGVQEHLRDQAITRRNVQLNSWQTACYAALAEDDWYCDGGFRVL
ncbi:hypothetical protein KLP40_17935 [Hymenobacter sp. NST-14]|uniref:hypothetical protein n=1 Tax=Hymenobacter piscis TaxID=2839984 RepID=UPI001C02D8D3|nr:hypothetical protein [Hymenobacter piscis]MBT9395052.1 hypothetical protein [Hymenobacter piscis]